MGICRLRPLSIEFYAIYVELDAVLEPALTLVNGLVLTRSRYVIFGKNTGLWHSLSIEIESHMGVCGAKFGQLPVVGPANARFGMSQARFEFLKFRQKVARG